MLAGPSTLGALGARAQILHRYNIPLSEIFRTGLSSFNIPNFGRTNSGGYHAAPYSCICLFLRYLPFFQRDRTKLGDELSYSLTV